MSADRPLVGLVPAAGRATRLGELPCSKEILPLDGEPVCAPLLRGMARAGVDRILVLVRAGKWDIAERLGDGTAFGARIAYVDVGTTGSVPETLSRATPWIAGCDVALGFPDILLEPPDAWNTLVRRHRASGDDVSLGCFPCARPDKADMVDLDDAGLVRDLVIKDPRCTYRWTWSIAVWTPTMTELLCRAAAERQGDAGAELWVGDIVRRAVDEGLRVRGHRFEDGTFLDVGTPDDLDRARRRAERRPDPPGRTT